MAGCGQTQVLHVDDDEAFRTLTKKQLESEMDALVVRTAGGAQEGLQSLAEAPVDCVVSDYDMPGQSGIEFLRSVREEYPDLPFILFTGKGSEQIASQAISAGVTDYLQKEPGTEQYELLANRIDNAVTAQQSALEAQRERNRNERLLKTVPSCVVQLDADGHFVYANDRAVEVLGLEQTEVTDRMYNDPEWEITDLDGEPIPDSELPFRQVRDTGEPLYDFRHTVSWPDGTRKVLSASGIPLETENGEVQSVLFSLTDITDRFEQERQLEALLENTASAIYLKDASGVYQLANDAFAELAGTTRSELVGSHVTDVFDEQGGAESRASDQQVMETEETITEEVTRVIDGTERTFLTEKFPFYDIDGSVSGVMGISRDITDRHQRQQELEAKNARLDEFASVVSHDLRGPLSVASGQLELAREETDNDRLDKIAEAHEEMAELIDHLLTLAREGDEIGDLESVDVSRTAGACWQSVGDSSVHFELEADFSIRADPQRFRQLLENLLRNAVEHGGHTVRLGQMSDGFYVEDDGPGIGQNQKSSVFDAGYSGTSDGSGFGLAIVKQIADAHGWVIDVTDSSDGGARFEITNIEGVD